MTYTTCPLLYLIQQIQPPRMQEADQPQMVAGDGSIVDRGTIQASGGWGLVMTEGTRIQGRLHLQSMDLTSTRCEVHALIHGSRYARYYEQICDNKGAIGLWKKAQWLVTQPDWALRLNSAHRSELRTLRELHREHQLPTPKWTRSHQEHKDHPDQEIRQQ